MWWWKSRKWWVIHVNLVLRRRLSKNDQLKYRHDYHRIHILCTQMNLNVKAMLYLTLKSPRARITKILKQGHWNIICKSKQGTVPACDLMLIHKRGHVLILTVISPSSPACFAFSLVFSSSSLVFFTSVSSSATRVLSFSRAACRPWISSLRISCSLITQVDKWKWLFAPLLKPRLI